jgi:hypothetical protein
MDGLKGDLTGDAPAEEIPHGETERWRMGSPLVVDVRHYGGVVRLHQNPLIAD